MSDELSDLQELAERAKESPAQAPVSVTMAILAVLVAVATLLGHRAHTEEVVLQGQAYDTWAQYQAKNIRQHEDLIFTDLTSLQRATGNDDTAKLRDKYSQEINRYKGEMNDLSNKARELEREVDIERNRADRFDLAEVFLEMGLVITSITMLSGRRIFWFVGLVSGLVGIVLAGTAFFLH